MYVPALNQIRLVSRVESRYRFVRQCAKCAICIRSEIGCLCAPELVSNGIAHDVTYYAPMTNLTGVANPG